MRRRRRGGRSCGLLVVVWRWVIDGWMDELGVLNDTLIVYVSLGGWIDGWMGRWFGAYTNGRGSPYYAFYICVLCFTSWVGWLV